MLDDTPIFVFLLSSSLRGTFAQRQSYTQVWYWKTFSSEKTRLKDKIPCYPTGLTEFSSRLFPSRTIGQSNVFHATGMISQTQAKHISRSLYLSQQVFLRVFSSPQKPTFPNSNSIWERTDTFNWVLKNFSVLHRGKQITLLKAVI